MCVLVCVLACVGVISQWQYVFYMLMQGSLVCCAIIVVISSKLNC